MYRIMLVDDEERILKALSRVLGRNKTMEIELFTAPESALKRAQTAVFDLVLSDYRMPQMDGVVFLTQLKMIQPESMRIIISGHADLNGLLEAINQAEIYRFISKPWDDYELRETVEKALAIRDLTVENRRLADQVRRQREEIERHRRIIERIEVLHPELMNVNWGEDGSIFLDEAELTDGKGGVS